MRHLNAQQKIANYERVTKWRKNNKLRLMECFENKCCVCLLTNEHSTVYDFHHLHETKKDFGISSKIRSWDKMVIEAKKCVMLCANCHRKIHAGLVEIDNPIPFKENLGA